MEVTSDINSAFLLGLKDKRAVLRENWNDDDTRATEKEWSWRLVEGIVV